MKILDDLNEDLELYRNDKGKYKSKVDEISKILRLKDDCKLQSEYMPTYYTGNLNQKNPIVLVGFNPGFDEEQNNKEDNLKSEDYFGNFFTEFYNAGFSNRYYERNLAKLLAGILDKKIPNTKNKRQFIYQELYQKNVVNIDLIPYHSKQFNLDKNLISKDTSIKNYITKRKQRFFSYLEELEELSPKLVILNGSIYSEIFSEYINDTASNITIKTKEQKDGKKVISKMYLFKMGNTPTVLFDKSISQAACGIAYADIDDKIVPKIKEFLA